jgi:hypothetical protein
MLLFRRAASLLVSLLLLAAGSHAQTTLGQPTLDEQKVQIWCATVRYVYDDNGRANLKGKLQCSSSLKAFEASIKADSQRVYSGLYQPLEGRGIMYKGLGSNTSRLQKLTTEIINRLKSSPTRRADPARMQRLATLEAALKNYVDNGTPIGDLSANEAAADPEADDASALTDEATANAPADAGPAEAGITTPAPPTSSGAGDSLMNKFFGPLALILSLLSLVLYVLLRSSIGTLGDRLGRHRSDIDSVKAAALSSPASSGAAPSERLTPTQKREVEQMVQQRLEEEMQKLRSQLQAAAPVVAVAAPTAPQPTSPASAPGPEYQQPVPAAPLVAAPQPAPVYSAPTQPAEVPGPPPVIPAGPPSASLHDEFESLVPPVQLPAPEPYVTPAPVSQIRYVKVPVNGAFSEYDLSDEPQHDSIYEIRLNPQQPDTATFRVTQNPQIHAYAIQSAQYSLREACSYQQPAGPVSRIVNEKDGVLRRIGGAWQIEQKAAIRFE